MPSHPVVSKTEWRSARKKLLALEKRFTRERDALSRMRRALPWERIEQSYVFDTPSGPACLADLFAGHSQLVVYHFMFAPDWAEGCRVCSFWADHFDPMIIHLSRRDVALIAVSRAPIERIAAFRRRMGWRFPWVSSFGNSFNQDFGVSFAGKDREEGKVFYNYRNRRFAGPEAPGLSVFAREGIEIFHTYSCYARGLDMLNGAYQYLDLVPKGRDEQSLPYTMAWVRHRDRY